MKSFRRSCLIVALAALALLGPAQGQTPSQAPDPKSPTLYLVGSAADRAVCGEIARGIGQGVVNLCGGTSLVELGSLLQEMNLAITVDSGPMHMATAVGVPVLAVFGATDPGRTGPFGGSHRVLTAEGLDCRPCFANACRRSDLACLDRVSAEAVVETAMRRRVTFMVISPSPEG